MKEVVPWPFPKSVDGFLWRLSSRFIISTVGFISKLILSNEANNSRYVLNKTRVINRHVLVETLDSRPCHVPVITVGNHNSCFDDPGLWSLLPIRHLFNIDIIRWSLTAHNICFTNEVHSQFFARGKCIPVVRGAGVYQRAMDYCIEKLNEGQWVHIFPEGRVNEKNEFIRFKWGVGRLIAESKVLPIVVPFWHCGMDEVLPNRYPYRFKFGKKVLVNIGQPVELKTIIDHARETNANDETLRKMITDKIQNEMMDLKRETERMYERFKKN